MFIFGVSSVLLVDGRKLCDDVIYPRVISEDLCDVTRCTGFKTLQVFSRKVVANEREQRGRNEIRK
jgi:hypothetical protein